MDTSPGPSERSMQTLWACLSDVSSGPSLAVCSSMERGGDGCTTSIAELYSGPSILTVAKAGRIRWLGHVMRMLDSCPTKKVFDSDPQFGIRRREAQRTRWLDQVKRDLLEIGCLHGWEA